MMSDEPVRSIGAVKFVLIHHEGCARERFHYRIDSDGEITHLLSLTTRGQHPNSLGIVLSGNFDHSVPTSSQIDALKSLLIELKFRFPSFTIGAHRQVRGDTKTTCPGTKFPMKKILEWAAEDLPQHRDEKIRRDIESQYGP